MEFLPLLLRQRFERAQVTTLRNVGCFLSLSKSNNLYWWSLMFYVLLFTFTTKVEFKTWLNGLLYIQMVFYVGLSHSDTYNLLVHKFNQKLLPSNLHVCLYLHQIKGEIRKSIREKMNQQYGESDDVTESIDKLQREVGVSHCNLVLLCVALTLQHCWCCC